MINISAASEFPFFGARWEARGDDLHKKSEGGVCDAENYTKIHISCLSLGDLL